MRLKKSFHAIIKREKQTESGYKLLSTTYGLNSI